MSQQAEVAKPEKADAVKVADIPKGAPASICGPSDRAPAGFKRFRIRGEHVAGNLPVRHLLAKDAAVAEAEYRRLNKADGGAEPQRLVLLALAD